MIWWLRSTTEQQEATRQMAGHISHYYFTSFYVTHKKSCGCLRWQFFCIIPKAWISCIPLLQMCNNNWRNTDHAPLQTHLLCLEIKKNLCRKPKENDVRLRIAYGEKIWIGNLLKIKKENSKQNHYVFRPLPHSAAPSSSHFFRRPT